MAWLFVGFELCGGRGGYLRECGYELLKRGDVDVSVLGIDCVYLVFLGYLGVELSFYLLFLGAVFIFLFVSGLCR